MKTWRERIAEARERGWFTEEDRDLVCSFGTCFVGEQVQRGVLPWDWYDPTLYEMGMGAIGLVPTEWHVAVRGFDPDAAERHLDAIEDRALELKRAQS